MIRLVAIVVLVICWAGGVHAQGSQDLSARAFTERVAAGLAAKLPGSKATVAGDLQITIRRAEGSEIMLSVRNLYQDYKANPGNIGAIIDVYAAGLAEKPARAAAKLDATRIVPVIKDRQWLEDNRKALRAKAPNLEFLFEDFNDELVIVYAEDTASRTRYLMANEDPGIDRAALRQHAVDNLLRLLPKVEVRNHDDVFSLISAGGDYEASLLLDDNMWRGGQIKVNGDIVVAIPAKDVLLVTGSKNRKGLTMVRKLAAEFAGQGRYRLTDALFVYRNGRFVKFGRK
jgi:uncharacterized protein YtpQ (UPF0354 family)